MTDRGRAKTDLTTFESLRSELTALAYRMLGDVGRAQDMVQETWLRWHQRTVEVQSPKAFLVTIVTRLCLNELDSARARREESRADRLPEPADLSGLGMDRLEAIEQVSMAFLVVLERLSPKERAAFLLHDVFDFSHDEIAPLVSSSPATSRKLLERARDKIADGRRMITASRSEHERLLDGFLSAVWSGDMTKLLDLLSDDVVIITDGGPTGRSVGKIRNLQRPLRGAARVAAFIAATAGSAELEVERRELNGRAALVFYRGDEPFAALLLAVADGKVQQIFFHGDVTRLGHVGPRSAVRIAPDERDPQTPPFDA
jgi:RNA polymerase sigma-70 factor, ECF subfamily